MSHPTFRIKVIGKLLFWFGLVGLFLINTIASSVSVFIASFAFVVVGAIIMIIMWETALITKGVMFLILFLVMAYIYVDVRREKEYINDFRAGYEEYLANPSRGEYAGPDAASRDFHRHGDATGFQTIAQQYYEQNNSYPVGQNIVLGEGEGSFLSYTYGFTAYRPTGTTYYLPDQNPTPGGMGYTYNSLNKDGSACTAAPCEWYELRFMLETNEMSDHWKFPLGKGEHVVTPDSVE